MYIDNNWTPVEGDELIGFLEQVGPIGGKYKVSPNSTKVEYRMLPFYDQVAMIRVKDPAWTPANLYIYYLTDQGNLYWLNGTSPPIHEVNAKAPVKITEENEKKPAPQSVGINPPIEEPIAIKIQIRDFDSIKLYGNYIMFKKS